MADGMMTRSIERTLMSKPEIRGIAPFFIVKDVPMALAFYRSYEVAAGQTLVNMR